MATDNDHPPWRKGATAILARVAIVAIILYLCYRIIQPFIIPLLWGGCLAIVFWPVNVRLRRHVRIRWIATVLSTVLVCVLIIGPALYLGAALVGEIVDLSQRLEAGALRGKLDNILNFSQNPVFKQIVERLKPWVDISGLDVKSLLEDNLRRLASYAVDQTSGLIANLSVFLLDLGVILLTLFFLFRDGDTLLALAQEAMPTERKRTRELFTQLHDVVRAALYGGVLVATVQGTLGGIAFAALGLAAPIFWGAVMALCSFIPIFGAALVYVPAAVILLLQGAIVKGLVLLGLGFGVISITDNLLHPLVVGSRTRIHTLILFTAILGGLRVFGLLGIVMGPVLAAVFVSLFNFYLTEMRGAHTAAEPPPA